MLSSFFARFHLSYVLLLTVFSFPLPASHALTHAEALLNGQRNRLQIVERQRDELAGQLTTQPASNHAAINATTTATEVSSVGVSSSAGVGAAGREQKPAAAQEGTEQGAKERSRKDTEGEAEEGKETERMCEQLKQAQDKIESMQVNNHNHLCRSLLLPPCHCSVGSLLEHIFCIACRAPCVFLRMRIPAYHFLSLVRRILAPLSNLTAVMT